MPDTRAKLVASAERVRRAFVLDGEPVLGISMFAALDKIGACSLDGILAERMSTHRVVHLVSLEVARAAFAVLPTFERAARLFHDIIALTRVHSTTDG